MFIFVIIFNLSLTVFNLYLLLKVRQWTKNLKTTTRVLTNVEFHVDRVLSVAPPWVMIGQKGTSNLRHRLRILAYQWQIIESLCKFLIMFKSSIKSTKFS